MKEILGNGMDGEGAKALKINWQLFVQEQIETGITYALGFAKQQGWPVGEAEDSDEIIRNTELAIAKDHNAPEDALIRVLESEVWEFWNWYNFPEWEDIMGAVLDNPNTTADVLYTFCQYMDCDFSHLNRNREDVSTFLRKLFEHPKMTKREFEAVADNVYGDYAQDYDIVFSAAPDALLRMLFEKIKEYYPLPWGAYCADLDDLLQAPSISTELFDSAVEFVLAHITEDEMKKEGDDAFESARVTIQTILNSPKNSGRFDKELRELQNKLTTWEDEWMEEE